MEYLHGRVWNCVGHGIATTGFYSPFPLYWTCTSCNTKRVYASMRSSYTVTLFSKPPQRESAPSGYVVSIALHCFIFAVILASVHKVRVVEKEFANRKDAVRLLNMRESDASAR